MKQMAKSLLQRLTGSRSAPEEVQRQDRILWEASARTRPSPDPETNIQWLRLQRELSRQTEPARTPVRRPVARLSIAIAFLALCVVGVQTYLSFREASVASYATGRGEQSQIALSDNSEVLLNHTTELVVERKPFDDTRYVTLRGEAFFRVAPNGAPFIVTTDAGSVEVLGTEFNVRARPGRLEVAVVRGSVGVRVTRDGQDSTVILTKGEITQVSGDAFPAAPQPLPFAEYPGWLHERFWFSRTDLASVCRELEARFDVVITIENARLHNQTITGVLDGRTVESALSTLSALTGAKYRHEHEVYSLY